MECGALSPLSLKFKESGDKAPHFQGTCQLGSRACVRLGMFLDAGVTRRVIRDSKTPTLGRNGSRTVLLKKSCVKEVTARGLAETRNQPNPVPCVGGCVGRM